MSWLFGGGNGGRKSKSSTHVDRNEKKHNASTNCAAEKRNNANSSENEKSNNNTASTSAQTMTTVISQSDFDNLVHDESTDDNVSHQTAEHVRNTTQNREERTRNDRIEPILSETARENDDTKEKEEEEEDDTYDILSSIEKTTLENRKLLTMLLKRTKTLESQLEEYDKLFSRLTEFLDVQQIQDARQHNRLVRLGMPVPFRSTQTDRVGMERVPSHSANRWQSVAQGPLLHRNAIHSHHHHAASAGQLVCDIGVHRDI